MRDITHRIPHEGIEDGTRRFNYTVRSHSDALRCWDHIRQRELGVEPSNAAIDERVQVHVDLSFCGQIYTLTGKVLSATEHGTALHLDAEPLELRRFMSELEIQEASPNNNVSVDWITDESLVIPMGDDPDSLEVAANGNASSSVEIIIEEEDSEDLATITNELDDMLAGLTEEDGEEGESYDHLADAGAWLDWTAPMESEQPRFRGEVTSRAMANLVQDLAGKRETGILRVDLNDRIQVSLWLEGRPMYFVADPPEEGRGLADALAAFPLIDRSIFETALERSEKTRRHLGLSLVDLGVMQPDEVADLMRIMARKQASMLPMRPGGRYRFWACPMPRVPGERRLELEVVLQWDPASLRDLPVVIG